MNPLEVTLYRKNMWECFIETLWSGSFPDILSALESETLEHRQMLIEEPLNGDSYAIHIVAEFGYLDIVTFFQQWFGQSLDQETEVSKVSVREILDINLINGVGLTTTSESMK